MFTAERTLGFRRATRWRYVALGLLARPTTTSLTVAAIFLPTVYLLWLGSFADRLYSNERRRLDSALSTRIVVTAPEVNDPERWFSADSRFRISCWPERPKVTARIELHAYLSLGRGLRKLAPVESTQPGDPQTSPSRLAWGRPISGPNSNEVILSLGFFRRLGGQNSVAGPTPPRAQLEVSRTTADGRPEVRRLDLAIVGLLAQDESDRALAPIDLLRRLDAWLVSAPTSAGDDLSLRINVDAQTPDDLPALVERFEKDGYKAQSHLAELAALRQTRVVLATLVIVFLAGVITLSALAVWITSSMSLQTRLHEIGLLRTLGLSANQVTGLFLRQGLLLGSVGLTLGVGVAYVGMTPIAGVIQAAFRLDPSILADGLWTPNTGWLLLVCAILSLGFPTLGLWLPARRSCQANAGKMLETGM